MSKLYLSVKEVAGRYSSSTPSIWRWVQLGRFPKPVKLNGTSTRWKVSDLEEWETKQERAGA